MVVFVFFFQSSPKDVLFIDFREWEGEESERQRERQRLLASCTQPDWDRTELLGAIFDVP